MKKLLIIALSVFVGVSLAAITFAQPAAEEATKPEIRQYAGEVVTMETPGKYVTLIVKGKDGEMTFVLNDADMNKPPEAGDRVIVNYTDRGGRMVAKSVIDVKRAKKALNKEAKAPEKTVARAK
jgi:hypothetical protein